MSVQCRVGSVLTRELAEFEAAAGGEDDTRQSLASAKLGLTLYKADLARQCNAQLGAVQQANGDRQRTALFTVPWRKPHRPASAPTDPTPGEPQPTT